VTSSVPKHLASRGAAFARVFVGPLARQRETWRLLREAAGEGSSAWGEAEVLSGLEEAPYEPLLRRYLVPRIERDRRLRDLVEAVETGRQPAARQRAMIAVFDYMVGLWRARELAGDDIEPSARFEQRVLSSFDEIASRARPGEDVAVVTSNGVIGCILERRVGARPELGQATFKLANTSITLVERGADGDFALRACNVAEHIVDPVQLTFL
jgi:broad specificity phosphatase PhoE